MTTIEIPDLCLVVLVGVTGSGKSTFARRHFRETEVLSSDALRAMVSDDPQDQAATGDAFAVLADVAGRRLRRGQLTVVDATSLRPEDRRVLLDLAKENDVFAVAVVLDVETGELNRRAQRDGRDSGVVTRQRALLRSSRKSLRKEGFRYVHLLDGVAEIDTATIVRTRLYHDKTNLHGPFDIIGDVHGCADELVDLLTELGWRIEIDPTGLVARVDDHPDGRKAIFVGDLVDRGPDTPRVLAIVGAMVEADLALCVRGNHEEKLVRALRRESEGTRASRPTPLTNGLAESMAQLARTTPEFRSWALDFLNSLIAHYVLDDGRLVIAHAGLAQRYHGRTSGRVRNAALYGETTGETDRWGFPVRIDWARDYRGSAAVVYGHTPVPVAAWVNNTLCIDTGCVFGGALTALRYPEREIMSVPARAVHHDPGRPMGYGTSNADDQLRARLTLADVAGKRSIRTRFGPPVTVREDNAAAALETMSRFAVDPRWLRYLPPTMSPVGSDRDDLLESPGAAVRHYAELGVGDLVCEEKHMGSRACLVIVDGPDTARRCFGVAGGRGAIYTRTGRAFFDDADTAEVLARVSAAAVPVMADLECSWMILDAEILPWNIKGEGLIRAEFAEVSAAATDENDLLTDELAMAGQRGLDVAELTGRAGSRRRDLYAFTAAYGRYVVAGATLADVRIAPFEVLACGGGASGDRTLENRPRAWHLACADALVAADPEVFTTTRRITVDARDPDSVARAESWWHERTSGGAEGMVVKAAANMVRDTTGRVLPVGLKVRGPDYLRIIYGPGYLDDLGRLRSRDLRHKRSMAAREYRLGREALSRHVEGAPLWQVHECVFGVLALESEPVDTRL